MVIPPGPGFQGLPQVMQDLLSDDARAERIANNSASLFRRYLSPGATNCYWRQYVAWTKHSVLIARLMGFIGRMFRSWAKVQAFETSRIPDQTSYESFKFVLLESSTLLRFADMDSDSLMRDRVEWEPH